MRWALWAVCLMASLVVARTAAAGEVAISDEARAHFRRGVALLKNPAGARYREAYDAFQAAYGASPSATILGNLGLCAMHLERDGEAILAYETYLSEGQAINATERGQILADIARLKKRVVEVSLTVTPRQGVLIDERLREGEAPVANRYELANEETVLGMRAGRHRLTVERAGHKTTSWEIELAPGTPYSRSLALEPEPPAPTPRPNEISAHPPAPTPPKSSTTVPTSVIVSAVATGALVIATIVVAGVATSQRGEFDEAIDAGDRDRALALKESGETLNVAADVLLASSAASALTTAALLVFAVDWGGESTDGLRVRPHLSPTLGAIVFGWSY